MITIPAVRDAIHTGIKEASDKYLTWSRGWTLHDSGVESLLVSEIASQLYKRIRRTEGRDSILLEVLYSSVQKWSGAKPKGPKVGTFRGNKRADLVVFNTSEEPKYVIEVKRRLYTKDRIVEDIEKLCHVTNKCGTSEGGSVKRGFLAAFDKRANKYSLSRREMTEQFEEEIRSSVASNLQAQIKSCKAKPLPASHSPPDHISFSLVVEVRAG